MNEQPDLRRAKALLSVAFWALGAPVTFVDRGYVREKSR